jgi:hypothetical protein
LERVVIFIQAQVVELKFVDEKPLVLLKSIFVQEVRHSVSLNYANDIDFTFHAVNVVIVDVELLFFLFVTIFVAEKGAEKH